MTDKGHYNMNIILGILTSLFIGAIAVIPWICTQYKISKDTYEQNLRMERKVDSTRKENVILNQKVDAHFDSSNVLKLRIEHKVDSLLKHKK